MRDKMCQTKEEILKELEEYWRRKYDMQAKERKEYPLCTGVLDYFPDALMGVAKCSKIGNDQHNPNEPLHWSRGKSDDHADCLLRHLKDRDKLDIDGVPHIDKVAWRALALSQLYHEKTNKNSKPWVWWKIIAPTKEDYPIEARKHESDPPVIFVDSCVVPKDFFHGGNQDKAQWRRHRL